MGKQTKEIYTFEASDLNKVIRTVTRHRVVLYKESGEQLATIPTVLAVIIGLIAPKLVGFLAVVGLFMGVSAKFGQAAPKTPPDDDTPQDVIEA